MLSAMDDRRLGLVLRALRLRLGMRQADVGAQADVSQQLVSMAELGRLDELTHRSIRRIASAVGASCGVRSDSFRRARA